jgi:hypothetical protein
MNRSIQPLALLIAVTALTRFLFRSRYLYDLDSVNFALALNRFDPTVHQPQPPGYFLYVCLGRLLAFHDANSALVAISIAFSCAAVAAIYVLAGNWFGRGAALFAGLIFVFSPLAWFYGTVALAYTAESFFSAITGYLCWRTFCGSGRFAVPAAACIGLAAGFRQSSLLFLLPLLLFSFRGITWRRAAGGLAALVFTLSAWLIPMVRTVRASDYLSSLESLWFAVPSQGTVFNSTPFNSVSRACTIAGIYLLCFGCAAILSASAFWGSSDGDRRTIWFTRVWIAPALLFFTFIFLRFVSSGYLLILLPPVCVWVGRWTWNWYSNPGLSKRLKVIVLGSCAAANTLIFLYAPLYCSYREVRRFEAELSDIIRVLPEVGSSNDTMIVGFDSHFLGYRHAGYYLPSYRTVQFPAVSLRSGIRVFSMIHRDTSLKIALPTDGIRRFLIFPQPSGASDSRHYSAEVRALFPPGALRTEMRGGHEFLIGPVADLRFLFPVAAEIRADELLP